MACRDFDHHLDHQFEGARAALPIELARHLEQCRSCRRLYRRIRFVAPQWEPSPDLRRRILAGIQDSLHPVHPVHSIRVRALRLIAVFAVLAIIAVSVSGSDAIYPMADADWFRVTAFLGAATVVLTFSSARQSTPGAGHVVQPAVLIGSALIGFGALIVIQMPAARMGGPIVAGFRCGLRGLGVAALGLIASKLLLRSEIGFSSPWLGASLGLLGLLLGALVLQFACSMVEVRHQLVWHFGTLMTSALVGYFAVFRPGPTLGRTPPATVTLLSIGANNIKSMASSAYYGVPDRKELTFEDELRELMVRYQRAEPAAVEDLVKRLSGPLLRFLSFPHLSRSDAEDLLQECWLRVHRARHTYRSSEPVLPWIYAIARHTRLDGYRRRRRIASQEVLMESVPEDLHCTEQPAVGNQEEFFRLLEGLPESQREVILMLKGSGMSLQEVARATCCSVGVVKQKAHRAYEKLRNLLEKDKKDASKTQSRLQAG